MRFQDQQLIEYLESENVPSVNLGIFKKKKTKIVKDISSFIQKADEVKQNLDQESSDKKQKNETKTETIKEPKKKDNIERRVRPLNLDFMKQKDDGVKWL